MGLSWWISTPLGAPRAGHSIPSLQNYPKNLKARATILEIDVDKNQQTAMQLGITSIPTLIIFKNRKKVSRFVGLQNAKSLFNALTKTLHP